MRLRFDPFVLDTATRELRRGDETVHLTPKAFDLLLALVEKRPEAVPKDELQGRLWPGTNVGDTSLAGVVAELRGVLGDDPRNPRFIRTVHAFGYAFHGTATDVSADPNAARSGPAYRLLVERREVALHAGENLLGRDRDAVTWLDSPGVSRRHARIVIDARGATLEDLGSHNGTFLQGRRIDAPALLADHDEIRLGSVSVVFRALRADQTETERDPE